MRGFLGEAIVPNAEAFAAWLRSAMINGKTRDSALINWKGASGARDAQPQEGHLLPLMVPAGAASGKRGAVHVHGHAPGRPISASASADPKVKEKNLWLRTQAEVSAGLFQLNLGSTILHYPVFEVDSWSET